MFADEVSGRVQVVDVAVPLPIFQVFSYSLPESLDARVAPGMRLLVPFGNRHLVGLAVKLHAGDAGERKLKPILKVLDSSPVVSKALLELGKWIAWYYVAPPGEAFRVMLPPGMMAKKASPDEHPEKFWPAKRQQAVVSLTPEPGKLPPRQAEVYRLLQGQDLPLLVRALVKEMGCSEAVLKALAGKGAIKIDWIDLYRSPWMQPRVEKAVRYSLTGEQQRVLDALRLRMDQPGFHSFLVHGVTASGKTEVYLNAISSVIERGKTALMLVPEIGLTPQVARQFRAWFGDQVAILHSALSAGERFDQWRRIRRGEASVVVGTRSAVFAPLANLGLIVVDEEHDGSYKQAEQPRYNGRDTALKRGQLEGALVVLGSATPQLETYHNASSRRNPEYLPLTSRILDRPLPTVHILDMKTEFQKHGKATIISDVLKDMIADRLDRSEQVLVLLNRRGYASLLLCRSCGHSEVCENCSITLTYHQEAARLNCHYCGYGRSVPKKCSNCGKQYVYFVGEGTERIQEEIEGMFPSATVDRLDRDTVQRKGSYERILGALAQGRTDILIGTQMIAKGHDFPRVTLVGVLGADQGLRLADFRAAERTFQLLTQVAGRAGRGDQPGEVVIQTYYPNHYSLKYACSQDYLEFARKELELRRNLRYPPFTALASVLIQSKDSARAWSTAEAFAGRLSRRRKEFSDSSRMRILGPAPAAIERLKGEFRVHILVRTTNRLELHRVLQASLEDVTDNKQELARISIDIDPVNLM